MMEELKIEPEDYDSEPKFFVEMNSLPFTNSVVKNEAMKHEDSVYEEIESKCILKLEKQVNFDNGVTPQPFIFLPVESEMQEVASTSLSNGVGSAVCELTPNMCTYSPDIQELTSIQSGINSKTLCLESGVDIHNNSFSHQDPFDVHDEFNKHYPVSAEIYEKLNLSNKTYTENSLNGHASVDITESTFVCKICQMSFADSSDLVRHEQTHIHQCEICKKIFTEKHSLERHMLSHAGEGCNRALRGERPYACDQCNKSFVDKYRLGRHKRSHTGERPFICDLCKKSFSQKSNLNKHKLIHFR